MNNKAIIAVSGVVLVLLLGFVFFVGRDAGTTVEDSELVAFAQCLEDSGTTFYGAFWCPHCQDQKEMFGGAEKNLPYVECSTPGGRGQLAVCREKNIEGYPTWEFADGSRVSGLMSLEELAEKTNCSLSQ